MKIATLESSNISNVSQEGRDKDFPSFADVVRSSDPKSISSTSLKSNHPNDSATRGVSDLDRKFNIVVYGIKECVTGQNRHSRLIQDSNEVASTISSIDSNISESSIRDCTRLGKFSSDRCRPILAKLSRSCEVSSILSQRGKLKGSGLSIKADLNKEDRKIDQLLMSHRWSLIQSGTSRQLIKIRGNSIFVNNVKKGSVTGGVFSESESNLLSDTEDQSLPLSNVEANSEVESLPLSVDNQIPIQPV